MISISKILTFGLLLWAGLLTMAPGTLCAQKVAWTIKNGVVSGETLTFEVWGRQAENSVPVLDTLDARHSPCPQWNLTALTMINRDGLAGWVEYSPPMEERASMRTGHPDRHAGTDDYQLLRQD